MRIGSAAHGIAQHWARTIRAAHPDLDGLAYRRRFAGGLCVALFTPAAQAFLDHPETIPSSAVRPPCSCLCLDSCTPGSTPDLPGIPRAKEQPQTCRRHMKGWFTALLLRSDPESWRARRRGRVRQAWPAIP
ncbi:hypothetical protein ACFQZK_00980 [Rhodococcus aetherivorans]